jgi:hypothetical protein
VGVPDVEQVHDDAVQEEEEEEEEEDGGVGGDKVALAAQ